MRKNVTLILILLIIIPVFGFWKETPEDVLIKFLKSLYSNNLKKTYSYISKVDEYNAIVNITVTKPNMSKVYAEIFGPFHGPKDMKNPQEATRHMLRQYLKKADVPMVEERGNFTLVKEEAKWKILLNLKNKD
jgi:hypothetical protein